MNLIELLNKAEVFIAQWAGTTMPRIVFVFLGILLCVWIGMAIWERRIRTLGAAAGLGLGLFMVVEFVGLIGGRADIEGGQNLAPVPQGIAPAS